MPRTLLAAAAALLAATGFAATASAREAATAGHAAVGYADLDLATSQGQAELGKRIELAARSVCTTRVTGSRLPTVDESCVAQAKQQIEHQLVALRTPPKAGG